MTSDTHTFVVKAERQDRPSLARRLADLQAVAADLASSPNATDADTLMHLAADVLLTLRADAADRELNSRMYGVG